MNLFQKIARKTFVEFDARRVLSRLSSFKRSIVDEPILSFAQKHFPGKIEDKKLILSGGAVKYQYLSNVFRVDPFRCNILYVVSSSKYHHTRQLIEFYRSRGVKIVWNQNGTYVPHFYGAAAAKKENGRLFKELNLCDKILFQSEFARQSTLDLVGSVDVESEVLYNAIDTDRFTPAEVTPDREPVILMAGSHNDPYRLELGIQTFGKLKEMSDIPFRMLIAGKILPSIEKRVRMQINDRGLAEDIELLGPYSQVAAPDVFRMGDILLHTKYCDVCPSMLLEGMACGLPIVFSDTGGTPELVGKDAGLGVKTQWSYDEVILPSSESLAECLLSVYDRLSMYRRNARNRVVAHFDQKKWLSHHSQLFGKLLEC